MKHTLRHSFRLQKRGHSSLKRPLCGKVNSLKSQPQFSKRFLSNDHSDHYPGPNIHPTPSYHPRSQSSILKDDANCPTIFQSPGRYIQKAGLLKHIGSFLKFLKGNHAGIIMSPNSAQRYYQDIKTSMESVGKHTYLADFQGECSWNEVNRITQHFLKHKHSHHCDFVVGIGGGKTVDVAKVVAHRLGKEVVIVPTLASNDAPCSALSVIYTDQGEFQEVAYFPINPLAVLVDTEIIAKAPPRYLVAGFGDAMATYYEARAVFNNPHARNEVGGRPTHTSLALSTLCRDLLFEFGEKSLIACSSGYVTEELEKVVEANTLLSGLGFESGGLAAAHGIHNALTIHPGTHSYLHGEKVAFCLLAQLMMEGQLDDARKVAQFYQKVKLPTTLSQIGIRNSDTSILKKISEQAVAPENLVHNLGFEVSSGMVLNSLIEADRFGQDFLH